MAFVTAAALVNELMEARDEKHLLRRQRQLAKVKLLIIPSRGLQANPCRAVDETTILNFRHLLERHELTEALFYEVKTYLEERALLLRGGTIMDATLIAASPSTKNKSGKRDPDLLGDCSAFTCQAVGKGYASDKRKRNMRRKGVHWAVKDKAKRGHGLSATAGTAWCAPRLSTCFGC